MAHQLLSKDTMFSVREMPWHRLGTVLPDYPTSIEDALEKSGLGWKVNQGSVIVAQDAGDPLAALNQARALTTAYIGLGHMPAPHQMEALAAAMRQTPSLALADDYRANLRADDGAVLGIVSDEYKVVQNIEAFRFLDGLIATDLYFETAGSLLNGRKVWVLARVPDFVEVGGDPTATYIYVANAHDGSMAVTASATNVRIVCANTLGWALRQSKQGNAAARTYKFRHTGDLAVKYGEARKVMGLTINWSKRFKDVGDALALEHFTARKFEKVLTKLIPTDDEMTKRMIANRERTRGTILDIFKGRGPDGDTRGNSPMTKWTAVNAVAEHADWCRRYTKATDQMARSFEDQDMKQRALDLITVA